MPGLCVRARRLPRSRPFRRRSLLPGDLWRYAQRRHPYSRYGAAGAVEALLAIQSLRTGQLPPQLGVERPLAGLEHALTGRLPAAGARYVASTNLGFGGSNAALIFAAP